MKANAPEKIYLQVCGDCPQTDCDNCKFEDLEDNITWCKDKIFKNDVEYVRKDAFIEKACDAYCRLCDTKECGDTGECDWVEKFRKRLMK